MSNPLLVEAIEDHFVPVLIYNNRSEDAKLLKQFKEPSWNNPVVRYLDANEQDLVPRKELVLSIPATAARMIAALKKAKRPVPGYLQGLAVKTDSLEPATFAMHCYWEGESQLGSIDGVYSTQSAWRGGLEVVELAFNPNEVSYAELVREAQKFRCATRVFAHTDLQLKIAKEFVGRDAVLATDSQNRRSASASDQKYYLAHSPLRKLALSEFQQTKLNAALRKNLPVEKWLSPRQQKLAAELR